MTRRIPLGALAIVVGLVAALLAIPAFNAAPASAATIDYVSLNNGSQLTVATDQAAIAAANQLGAHAANGRSATVGMTRLLRGGGVVQQAPDSYQFPMGVTAMALDAAAATMSPGVAAVLQTGQIVLGSTSAGMRGAQVGDVVEFNAAGGNLVQLQIGLIANQSTIGGAEFVVGDLQADALGLTLATRVLIWGFSDRAALESALSANGLISTTVRVNRSWDIASPDSTLSLSDTKAKLGEFPYRLTAGGGVQIIPSWVAANLSGGGVRTPFASIGISASCHNAVRGSIQGALTEIAAKGLAGAIDVSNTNQFGGCFYPRFNRLSGNVGGLSRHSWGMAIDMNTTTNVEGGVPHMDCRVVQIFRKWGFAWGGNFLVSDGMHFEYVGSARDQVGYPSRYCPTGAPIPPYGGVQIQPVGPRVANPSRVGPAVERTAPGDTTPTTAPAATTVPASSAAPVSSAAPAVTPNTAAVASPGTAVPSARPGFVPSVVVVPASPGAAAVVSQRSVMFGSDGFGDGGD